MKKSMTILLALLLALSALPALASEGGRGGGGGSGGSRGGGVGSVGGVVNAVQSPLDPTNGANFQDVGFTEEKFIEIVDSMRASMSETTGQFDFNYPRISIFESTHYDTPLDIWILNHLGLDVNADIHEVSLSVHSPFHLRGSVAFDPASVDNGVYVQPSVGYAQAGLSGVVQRFDGDTNAAYNYITSYIANQQDAGIAIGSATTARDVPSPHGSRGNPIIYPGNLSEAMDYLTDIFEGYDDGTYYLKVGGAVYPVTVSDGEPSIKIN